MLVADERRDLVAFLRTLSDEEWEAPSLCAGWRVRDVIAHVLYDAIPVATYTFVAVRSGSADKLNARFVDDARGLTTSELIGKLESTIGRGVVSKVMPHIAFADIVVHHQDIRRPLGRPRTIDADRIVPVLNRPDPFAFPWRRTRGLRFVATDVDWAKGSGPEVRGTGEALALAMAGRPVVLDELEGDGVAVLRTRMG
jgi:uncharacterized protein (TIGR03083 family)